MNSILNVNEVSKFYGKFQALQSVSFEVPNGSIYGILGPNGSGKTTLLGILLDVLKASSGSFSWNVQSGQRNERTKIGSLLETPNFYHYMSAFDNLKLVAMIKGCDDSSIDVALKLVGLFDRKDYPFSSFSLGMKQRLAIGSALLGNPEILVFDEPTNGLDPNGITEIRALILKLRDEGKTIIMASHLLDEVEKVCTNMVIIKKGKMLANGSVSDLLTDDDWIEMNSNQKADLIEKIKLHPAFNKLKDDKNVLVSFNQKVELDAINRFCFEHGIVLNHLILRKRSLESKFMEITN